MKIYLGLGSNIHSERAHLDAAIVALKKSSFRVDRVSPPFLNPPVLPQQAPEEWYRPFWNLVIEGEFTGQPLDLLALTQQVEREINLSPKIHNAPRAIDIDILWWGEEMICLSPLTIPHPEAIKRNFVLSPMVYLRPDWCPPFPSSSGQTILSLSRQISSPLKSVMAIINLTPDSFSDGGSFDQHDHLRTYLTKTFSSGVSFLDLGAESTRPHAKPLSSEEEWQRLLPALCMLKELMSSSSLGCRPWISIDSYHAKTIERAIDMGVIDIANDVSGLKNPEYIEVIRQSHLPVIAMHNLGVPADPKIVLNKNSSPTQEVKKWCESTLEKAIAKGVSANKIFFDPGIGFGKSAHQSLQLLQQIDQLSELNTPIVVGHSRKSFLRLFTEASSSSRDQETLGASLALFSKPIEILRVHDYQTHLRAQMVFQSIYPSYKNLPTTTILERERSFHAITL